MRRPRPSAFRALAGALCLSGFGLVQNVSQNQITPTPAQKPWLYALYAVGELALIWAAVRDSLKPFTPDMDAALKKLASSQRSKWAEHEGRHLENRPALPVRWRTVPPGVADHWENVLTVPDHDTDRRPDLDGTFDHIVEVYRRARSGRLVVLGRPGAGKTTLAVRFVLEILADTGPRETVPVLVNVAGWDPNTTLNNFVAGKIIESIPELAAHTTEGTVAGTLMARGLVLPVLDGFDEMPFSRRSAALRHLREHSGPMVLTSRVLEYENAVYRDDVLSGAAVVEITDLDWSDAEMYLARTERPRMDGDGHGGRSLTAWAPVFEAVRGCLADEGTCVLASVLSTPLMLWLARVVYRVPGSDPMELLDSKRFSSRGGLEEYLLGKFIPAAYDHAPDMQGRQRVPHWKADQAVRWLSHLAHIQAKGGGDIAWWRLGESISTRARTATGAAAIGLVTAIPALTWIASIGGVGLDLWHILLIWLAIAWALGSVVSHVVTAPARITLRGRSGPDTSVNPPGCYAGPIFGVLAGTAIAISDRASIADRIGRGAYSALLLGIAFGWLVSVIHSRAVRHRAQSQMSTVPSPIQSLALDRTNTLLWAFLLGMPPTAILTARWASESRATSSWATLWFELWFWFSMALSLELAVSAWGRWLLFGRCWLPLTDRLPWQTARFLADAQNRGVLRQIGPLYQFRHARLQDLLSTHHEQRDASLSRARRRIRRQLWSIDSKSPSLRAGLAESLTALYVLLQNDDRHSGEARRITKEAAEIYRKLALDDAATFTRDFARALIYVGDAEILCLQYSDAIASYAAAIDEIGKLPEDAQRELDCLNMLSFSLTAIARFTADMGYPEVALDAVKAAINVCTGSNKIEALAHRHASAVGLFAMLLEDCGQLEEAEIVCHGAMRLYRELEARDDLTSASLHEVFSEHYYLRDFLSRVQQALTSEREN